MWLLQASRRVSHLPIHPERLVRRQPTPELPSRRRILSPRVREWSAPLVVALVTAAAFGPALHNGWVSWDDEQNFLTNPHYRGLGLSQLSWMWTTFHMGHYVPLSWMTLGLDYELWGMQPMGYHLTSLLLHTVNAVLVYHLARGLLKLAAAGRPLDSRLLVSSSAFAALFFSVHPLRVESVVWVTERRDVLSMLFSLACILAYLRSASAVATRRVWYGVAVALFLCALLSKATPMTLPAVLLILEVYPLRRLGAGRWWSAAARRIYARAIPFGILSVGSMALSIVALRPAEQLGITAKVAVSAYGLSFYLWKTIVPLRLSPLYEMPQHVNALSPIFIVSYVTVLVACWCAWWCRHRWPAVTAGWLAFVAITLPMLGLVQNGPQIAADRYTYHAAPALAILLGVGIYALQESRWRHGSRWAGAAVVVALGAMTQRQTGVWESSGSLWMRVLSVDPGSAYAHSARASLLYQQDRVDDAMTESRVAISLAPGFAEAHNNLGVGLARQGKLADARMEYQRAIALKAGYDEAQGNLGAVLAREGNADAAITQYAEALRSNPQNADAHVNWGNLLVRADRLDEAISHYRTALDIRPDHADAQFNWGVALARGGRFVDAIEHFRRALVINPNHAEARAYLAQARRLSS